MKSPILLLLLAASFCLQAEDIKLTDGRILTGAKIIDSDPASIIVVHDGGVENVPFESCPLDIQATYGYSPQEAAAFREERQLAAVESAPEQSTPSQAELHAMLAVRQAEIEAAEQGAAEQPKRETDAGPFGVRLGKRYEGGPTPLYVKDQVKYFELRSVPAPSPAFGSYLLLVSESSNRIIGVEATGSSIANITEISADLTDRYGRPHERKWRDGIRSEKATVWRDGQMQIVLRTAYGTKLTYILPH